MATLTPPAGQIPPPSALKINYDTALSRADEERAIAEHLTEQRAATRAKAAKVSPGSSYPLAECACTVETSAQLRARGDAARATAQKILRSSPPADAAARTVSPAGAARQTHSSPTPATSSKQCSPVPPLAAGAQTSGNSRGNKIELIEKAQ